MRNALVRQCCGAFLRAPLRDILAKHTCGGTLQNTPLKRSTLVCDARVGRCGAVLWDTFVRHSCWTLFWATAARIPFTSGTPAATPQTKFRRTMCHVIDSAHSSNKPVPRDICTTKLPVPHFPHYICTTNLPVVSPNFQKLLTVVHVY